MGLKESGLRGSLRSTSSVLPAFFDVTITNTNSPVQEGDILTVDYSADNTGDAQDTQDIRLEIDSVEEDRDSDITLLGAQSTTGTLEWDTTDEDETTYTATVLSDDDTDSVTVEIESAIPDSGVSRYIFPEGSGDITEDDWGDNDGSLIGDAAFDSNHSVIGDFSITGFENDTARVELPPDDSFGFDVFTIMARIRNESADTFRIVRDQDGSNIEFSISNDDYYFIRVNGDNSNRADGSTGVNESEFTHVTAIHDGDEQRVYVNGSLDGSNSSTVTLNDVSDIGLQIGSANHPTNAQIDDVRIYNAVLSDQRISDIASDPSVL